MLVLIGNEVININKITCIRLNNEYSGQFDVNINVEGSSRMVVICYPTSDAARATIFNLIKLSQLLSLSMSNAETKGEIAKLVLSLKS